MPARVYVVHGSHPCAAVEKAFELKGLAYKRVELPPPSHVVVMRRVFGDRTVPGVTFEDGAKVHGSTAIMRELDRRVPSPPLFPDAAVEEAEAWGEAVFQPIARRLLWRAFALHPRAMYRYQEGQSNPRLPMPVVLAAAPLITRAEKRMNAVSDEAVREDLRRLPEHLDRIDAWIAGGVLGGEVPNAADLQIATTLRLLHTLGDVRPLIAGRPAERLAFRWFDRLPGETPPGVFPREWVAAA